MSEAIASVAEPSAIQRLTPANMAFALNALGRLGLFLTVTGQWGASSCGVRIVSKSIERSPVGFGSDPNDAIVALWHECTDGVSAYEQLVSRGVAVRWNGFMWAPETAA